MNCKKNKILYFFVNSKISNKYEKLISKGDLHNIQRGLNYSRRNELKRENKSESAFGAQTPVQYILQYEGKLREHKHKKNILFMGKNTQFTSTCKKQSRKVQ